MNSFFEKGSLFLSNMDNVYYKVVGMREDDFGIIYTMKVETKFYLFKDIEYLYPDFEIRDGHIKRLMLIKDWVLI